MSIDRVISQPQRETPATRRVPRRTLLKALGVGLGLFGLSRMESSVFAEGSTETAEKRLGSFMNEVVQDDKNPADTRKWFAVDSNPQRIKVGYQVVVENEPVTAFSLQKPDGDFLYTQVNIVLTKNNFDVLNIQPATIEATLAPYFKPLPEASTTTDWNFNPGAETPDNPPRIEKVWNDPQTGDLISFGAKWYKTPPGQEVIMLQAGRYSKLTAQQQRNTALLANS